jgi:hypothetical protein
VDHFSVAVKGLASQVAIRFMALITDYDQHFCERICYVQYLIKQIQISGQKVV